MMQAERARQFIEEKKMMEALQADDEDTIQFRNVVTAAKKVVDDLGAQRQRLSETGHYTDEGLASAMADLAAEATAKLSALQSTILAPRQQKLQTEIQKLPDPTVGDNLSDMERHRIITAYLDGNGDKRNQMRAEAIKNRKIAAALVAEDPAVTGLSEAYLNELRTKITNDPHQKERSTLAQKMNAARAAQTAIEGATVSVRRATEVIQ